MTLAPVKVEIQLILKVSETLLVLESPAIFPDKLTTCEPLADTYPEKNVGVKESEAVQEETLGPDHCRFTLVDK